MLVSLVLSRMRRVFYGWWIVAVAMVSMAMSAGLFLHGFGFYFEPIRGQFGWSRSVISGAYSLSRFESGFLGPLEGYLIQRFGSRTIMAVGIGIFALGFVFLSRVDSIFSFYIAFLLLSMGSSFGGWSPVTASINNWFRRHRSKAIGFSMLGLGLGGVAFSPLVASLIDNYGWQKTALVSGIVVAVVGIPLSRLVRFSPEPYGYLPDGDSSPSRPTDPSRPSRPAARPSAPVPEAEYDFTVKEAMRTSAFWVMSIGHAVALLAISALSLHQVAYLESELDFSTGKAAQVVMVLAGLNMVGQPLGGFLGDRYSKKYIALATLVGHCIGLVLLATADSFLQVMVAAAVQGVAWGIRGPVLTSMRGEYFGRKSFPMIMGFSNTIMMVGMIIGPLLVGFMADEYSYRAGFLVIAVAVGAGSLLFLFLKRPSPPVTSREVS